MVSAQVVIKFFQTFTHCTNRDLRKTNRHLFQIISQLVFPNRHFVFASCSVMENNYKRNDFFRETNLVPICLICRKLFNFATHILKAFTTLWFWRFKNFANYRISFRMCWYSIYYKRLFISRNKTETKVLKNHILMFFMFLLFVFPSFDFILRHWRKNFKYNWGTKFVSSMKHFSTDLLLLYDYSLIILFPVAKIICFFHNI